MIDKIVKAEKYWLVIAFLIALLIFIQSNFSSIVTNDQFYKFQFDKITHMLAWAGLSFSLRLGTNTWVMKQKTKNQYYALLFLIIICSLYGVTDEVHQYFIPSRSSDLMDVIADSIGSIIGIILGHTMVILNTKMLSTKNDIIQ